MIVNDLLPINEFSRPGRLRTTTRAIILHNIGKPGQSAKAARDYWAGLSAQGGVPPKYASAHYIVGLSGEIIRAVPDGEVAYHCGSSQADPASGKLYTDWARQVIGHEFLTLSTSPNQATIGVELCHPGADGAFLPITLSRAAFLVAALCLLNNLDPMARQGRHWDVVGWKDCPLYYVKNPLEWDKFKRRVAAFLEAA